MHFTTDQLCGAPHNGSYAESMIMLSSGGGTMAGSVFS